jgi:hypothetical protein
VKEQASQAISATQKSATEEITKAGQHASDNATKAAQKAIDEALDKPGVQRLIQHSVEEKVASAVEEQIQRDLSPKIDVFRSLVTEIGEISNRGAQLRLGFRPGLDYLVKKMESGDPAVRAYAKSTLIVIGADYDQKIRQLADTTPNSDPLMAIGGIGMTGAAKTPKGLMGLIRNVDNPAAVAAAFFDMKKLTDWNVQTFDIPAAEKWCANHKPKCDE